MADLHRTARRLRDLVEPVAASVYFAPECHDNYATLGFGASPGEFAGVAAPEMCAYFTSRGACLGQVPGEIVTAAFGVFTPAIVVPAVTQGWATTDRESVLAARLDGQRAQLERILGAEPDGIDRATELLRRVADAGQHAGRPMFAGLASLGFPGDPMGDFWRAADLVREHRGDCHTIAWTASGLTAPEVMLVTELWWGMPARSYSLTRGWTTEQYDAAEERLRTDGLLDDSGLTTEGRALRSHIEHDTDRLEMAAVAALGDDAGELFELLEPWSASIVAGGGYPANAFQTLSDLALSDLAPGGPSVELPR
jgi:hypothetical protein